MITDAITPTRLSGLLVGSPIPIRRPAARPLISASRGEGAFRKSFYGGHILHLSAVLQELEAHGGG
jgi:hypothetical protein